MERDSLRLGAVQFVGPPSDSTCETQDWETGSDGVQVVGDNMIRLFCRHDWEVRVKTKASPLESIRGGDPRFVREAIEAMNGSTSVVMTCKKCGKVTTQTLPGIEMTK